MANHKSALKRAIQNEKQRIRNKALKTRVKNMIKELVAAVNEKAGDTAFIKLNKAKSVIDKASQKGAMHKNTAARKISRISKIYNSITT